MQSQETYKPKLLVVDDEPDNLDLLYRTFHRDYQVLRAENGVAALEILAREENIAVIISDQRMPLMSGTELLSLTATQYPDIIRIILTGYTDVENLVEAINTGKVFKYVTKPWNAEDLKSAVRQALDTHNVLKLRTRELSRSLRRERLLNTVTNTIRNAQYDKTDASPLQEILQRIVETVGQVLEIDICILRPCQKEQLVDEWFVYEKSEGEEGRQGGEGEEERQGGQGGQGGQGREDSPLGSKSLHITSPLSPLTSKLFLAQTVWETREVTIVNDVLTDERFYSEVPDIQLRGMPGAGCAQAYQKANIRSTLVVPLISQQELVAVMALHQCGEPHIWENDEIELVVMVADQAALALSQARAYERIQALATQQTLINTITTAIRSTLDPKEIFTAITQQLAQALKVDGCVLSLWSEEDEFVQCVGLYDGKSAQVFDTEGVSFAGDKEEVKSQNQVLSPRDSDRHSPHTSGLLPFTSMSGQLPQSIVPIGSNPVLRQLIDTQQPVIVNDMSEYPEIQEFDLGLRQKASALLLVPLLTDGKIIGSITLRQTNKPRQWLSSEIDLAQSVASQAAIAVQQSRLYQKTRQQAERLIELDRQKPEFFQNVSHEFRTPLTLTVGPLESVVNQKQGLSYEQSAIALRNSRRLLRLVNQLLDLQRLDAKRMQPSFRPCDFGDFVTQIVEIFRPYCEKKRIGLSTQIMPCSSVYLDLEKFDKVLYNLLSNAMKFTNSGGNITVIVEPAGDYVRLQTIDTGIGINKEQIPHLFERFRQAEGSVNRSYEGSGLGLALVKELVELHGGQISVDSEPNRGTTFTIWLQTGTAHLPGEQILEVPTEIKASRGIVELADLDTESILEDEPDNDSEENEETNDSGKILVVDDNSDLRGYVAQILRQVGYQVMTARNGHQGFQIAQKKQPQLIITDLMMPEVSGLDLIELIRAKEKLKGTPIILLTAKADELSRIEGREQGADAYLSKPFNDRELLAEVRNLLALKANERKVVELNNYLTESVLKRFLPPAMVEKAAKGELVLDLHPEPRLITTLFSDIVGFTQLSNTLRSLRIADLLNQYLAAMTEAIFENGGTVNKFMGDGILAIFGAPEEISPQQQALSAIATGRQMLRSLQKLNQEWEAQGIVGNDGPPPVRFRCGIHQGTAVVGMFGGRERLDYTAIGPAVNIASRLQEAAQPNSILISASVADWLEDRTITKCSPLKLKGVDETVLTFAVNPTVD